MRCIRTDEYLLILNLKPARWPAGDPPALGDVDDSPSKREMIARRDSPDAEKLYARAFEKRPSVELYRIADGYACDRNIAGDPENSATVASLKDLLVSILQNQHDPRFTGSGDEIDGYTYYAHHPF